MQNQDFVNIEKNTHAVYERNAERFDKERSKTLFEKTWQDRFLNLLPQDAKILDVGCGAGEPIAKYYIEKGFDLTGVDFAHNMLQIARTRFPDNNWYHMDMRQLKLQAQFDGIIAWHSFFHLTHADQEVTLRKFAEHLAPGGVLMLTVGDSEGEVLGHVGGEQVYHASFSPEKYAALLNGLGIAIVKFVPEDPECGGSSILLAQKRP